ncbi:MAG: hypothetical protein A3F54_01750 [Candidatus Kerfeldbacteria bacterium RIFCSPHIGHO2_12_FULL_48_17]|uniref:Antitoxin SocA-like Panacea domain-containing protein n=1 Tax=Candidatus Kerfeldbacteria bacterium RIFCSPHIGHO2_12_FULL_48_17 TaxID=1798542 RepID=A0A1G2B0H8_9BACT|nr:MAG: hypothetical protein A3F54_01750 [Candidatus Kerfeldbacteria bacterium RIFCSPHIGHO2_12_FULL_48_17]
MQIPKAKLKAMLRYFCTNTDPRFLGKTKLMKLFYFVDFTHVKKYGMPITNDTYYHLEKGPIPSAIKNLVDAVDEEPEQAILSDTIEVIKNDGQFIHRIKCLKEFTGKDKEYFSDIEFRTLQSVCERFNNYTTEAIVDASHREAPWKKTSELGQIPYTLAAEDPDCKVSKEEIELLQKII